LSILYTSLPVHISKRHLEIEIFFTNFLSEGKKYPPGRLAPDIALFYDRLELTRRLELHKEYFYQEVA
jgi:hypothetical protein